MAYTALEWHPLPWRISKNPRKGIGGNDYEFCFVVDANDRPVGTLCATVFPTETPHPLLPVLELIVHCVNEAGEKP